VPHQATVYRILIASPSDVKNERRAIPEVIHAWNAANATATGLILEPVLWETHATPEMGDRPQAIVNKQIVKDSDILVAIFWTRLGTQTGEAESGTAEEIEEFIKAGKPVLLYFSSVPVALESVDQDQYKRLLAFRKKMEGRGLVSSVESVEELREKFQGHLTRKIHELSDPGRGSGGNRPGPAERQSDAVSPLTKLKARYARFLSRLRAEWISEKDSAPQNIEEAQAIMARARQTLLDFRTELSVFPSTQDVVGLLDQAASEMAAMQHHQMYIDGGASWKRFWLKGDQMIELLEQARRVLGPSYLPTYPSEETSLQN
jgi:hypothetical protein